MRDCSRRVQCALCGWVDFDHALSLDQTPLANEFVKFPGGVQEKFPLHLGLCANCGHLQVMDLVSPERLFKNYVYATGTSQSTVEHFRKQANELKWNTGLKQQDLIVELGSNDGTLLKEFVGLGMSNVLGVDPATKIVEEANASGIPTLKTFFTEDLAEQILASRGPAKLVVANNMFAHAPDLRPIISGVKTLIGETGVFVFEVSYLMDIARDLTFDTIYHEHFSYHALTPLVMAFDRTDMKVIRAETTQGQVGRGSLRVYACSKKKDLRVETTPINRLLREEKEERLFDPRFYAELEKKIAHVGLSVRSVLKDYKGAKIAGYGAAAKLTTLMYALGLTDIPHMYVVDDSKWKQGLHTPGTHIPVVAPDVMYEMKPDVVVVYAWNFADEILKKHAANLPETTFVVPLPRLKTIGARTTDA